MSASLLAAVVETPAAPLSVLVHDDVLVAAGFTPHPEALHERLSPARRALPLRAVGDLGYITAALRRYLDGELDALNALAVDQHGTPFQQQVWAALRAVPAGETVTYAELARRTGNPGAVRAAGAACGRNLIAPVVPCHRIVRSDGSLGGYYYGLRVKRWLLDHERRFASSAEPTQLALAVLSS